MKPISKAAWDRVLEKACEIAHSSGSENDPMFGIHLKQMLEILDDLEKEFGPHSQILDTRADYTDSLVERRQLSLRTLDQTRTAHKEEEVRMIMKSLRHIEEEMESRTDPLASDT